jgi:predicted HicB family RNase H-like nuclease
MIMANKKKTFFKMTAAERDEDVARYDAGVNFEDTVPLTAAQKARFERARQTQLVQPSEELAHVLISVDPKLLAKAHARARKQGKTFSSWVSELLQASVRRAG